MQLCRNSRDDLGCGKQQVNGVNRKTEAVERGKRLQYENVNGRRTGGVGSVIRGRYEKRELESGSGTGNVNEST